MKLNALPTLLTALALLAPACGDEGGKRPLGGTCNDDLDCQSGVCGGNVCLDPALDTDTDGLINRIEAALDTDPVVADSDGDGIADGVEVGANPDAPADGDGDGRIDARESASEDCDGDQQPDQADASDGLDAKGNCQGQVVVSPCSALCDRASALQCPALTGCLTSCSEVFTALDATCRRLFADAGKCAAEADEAGCAAEGAPTWQLFVPASVCASEIGAVGRCLGGIPCPDAVPLALDTPTAGRVDDEELAAYAVVLEADKAYEVTLRAGGQSDDTTLVLFASGDALCDWIQDPLGTEPLGLWDAETGMDTTLQIGPGPARTVEVLLVNDRSDGQPSSYTIEAHELGI